jgi:hypothetical protein
LASLGLCVSRGGGLKRALRSPGRYAAGRCRLCSSCLRGEAHAEGAGVKAAQRSAARLERRRSGRSLALTQERAKRTLRRLQAGRTAAVSCRPGERPPSLPAPDASPAMGSLPRRPDPRHTARPVKDRSTYPGSAATHEGRGGTLPPHGPPATVSPSSGTRVRRLSPGTYRACDCGPPAPMPAWPALRPALAASPWWPSSSCAPRGRALTQESCGSTLRSLARREKTRRGTTAGAAKPLTSRSGKRSAEPLEGVWGREESAARAERSGAGADRCVPRGADRGGKAQRLFERVAEPTGGRNVAR